MVESKDSMSTEYSGKKRFEVDKNVENVAFVILHYLSYELTAECIDSVLALGAHSKVLRPVIVVIDNASNNGSLERLKESYGAHADIAILENDSNQGFSRANNRAFRYAVETYAPKHVVVLNNDTVIDQADFLDRLDEIYERENCPYVIGPDIFVRKAGVHQSPLFDHLRTREEAVDVIAQALTKGGQADERRVRPVKRVIRDILKHTSIGNAALEARRRRIKEKYENKSKREWWKPNRDCVFHGAAIVFTLSFISLGEDPFFPETFLYAEESILAARCKRNGWDFLYTPELQVLHFDQGSTNMLTDFDADNTFAFYLKHVADSYKVLIDYMDDQGTEVSSR